MARTPKKPHAMTLIWRKKLGEWIRERRESNNHSQDSFGSMIGLSVKTINVIENGSWDYGIDEALAAIACVNVAKKEDLIATDPVLLLVSAVKGLNALSAEELAACRTILAALNDRKKKNNALTFLRALNDDADDQQKAVLEGHG
jgi:Predicted transcriptional regulators